MISDHATRSIDEIEIALAEITLLILRANNVSDDSILIDFCGQPNPGDTEYERWLMVETGKPIAAARIRNHIKRLVMN